MGLDFSPDSKLLTTVGSDGAARIWSLQDHKSSLSLKGQKKNLTTAAFSPDGRWTATASQDKSAWLWNAESGKAWRQLEGHTDAVSSVAFDRSGEKLVTGSTDRTARIWHTRDGRLAAVLEAHTGPIVGVAFSPDGTRAATASEDGTGGIWDAVSGRRIATLRHLDKLTAISFAERDGRLLLATASLDGTAKIWDASGKEMRTLGHKGGVSTISFSQDAKKIATGGADGRVRIWDSLDSNSRNPIDVIDVRDRRTARRQAVSRADLSGENQLLVVTESATCRLIKLTSQPRFKNLDQETRSRAWEVLSEWSIGLPGRSLGGASDVSDAAFSPDGRFVVTVDTNGLVRLWHSDTGLLFKELRGKHSPILAMFHPDGLRVLTLGYREAIVDRCEACRPIQDIIATSRKVYPGELTPQQKADYL
jgi:WD40 repeat protein